MICFVGLGPYNVLDVNDASNKAKVKLMQVDLIKKFHFSMMAKLSIISVISETTGAS